MDFRDILKSFDNLSEGEKTTTDKGTVHKAGPGGYGNKHGVEDIKDQYGKPVGRASLSKMDDKPPVKRGKGRPPKAADSSGEVKKYDSSELSKAMGMGKPPKATGKPSVKHSLREYFDQLDQALSEGGLSVQPIPAPKQQSGQNFMIKDPSNPQAAAITTTDPAVVDAAKNGTMSMQKPGAAPTSQGATPATGAGSQVAPMEEGQLDEISPELAARVAAKRSEQIPVGAGKHVVAAANMRDKTLASAFKRGATPDSYDAAYRDVVQSNRADWLQKGKPMTKQHTGSAAQQRKVDTAAYGIKEEGDIGKHNNATTGFDALVRKLTPKYGKEAATKIAGAQLKKIGEAEAPPTAFQSSPLTFEGKKGVNPFAKKDTKKKPDADGDGIPDYAEDGKGSNDTKKKGAAPKKGVNPFAKKDEKKKVKEGMEHHLQAARLEGKSHALRKMPYNCTHEDMEEARHYHEGFKEGLDECYGQMPILGRTAVGEVSPEVGAMASYGAHTPELDEMDKTSYMKQQAIKTPGNTFKAFGQTMRDNDVLDEFAFESLDKQLNSLLESEEVSEGMTVSISKGQQGTPDSVSVSAQDGEADQLLSIIKSAGMGLFGGEEKGFNAPEGTGAHGGISVVDDHDGMMSLMKKLSGNGGETSNGDFADEEGGEEHGHEEHSHEGEEEPCNECGMAYESCGCDHGDEEVVDEEESEDQMMYNVAEEGAQNPPDNGSANSSNATQGNDAANASLAVADAGDGSEEQVAEDDKEDTTGEEAGKEDDEEEVEESIYESYANSADDTFEADIDFMTKVISGGLNKQKSTGQTTVPVIAGQKNRMGADGLGNPMQESTDLLSDYRKLSGL